MNKKYEHIQEQEALTWNMPNSTEEQRKEKAQRETCRYPMIAKQIGLDYIDTSNMVVFDIGCGPLQGVSSVLPFTKKRICIDPLKEEYAKCYEVSNYLEIQAEDLKEKLCEADLIIITNALDHFENPIQFLQDLVKYGKPGMFFGHYHAINNALTHPHDAHEHNINPELLHSVLDTDFETVWELKYPEVRYGWVQYQGKVGQPAFCGLFRKTTGYK